MNIKGYYGYIMICIIFCIMGLLINHNYSHQLIKNSQKQKGLIANPYNMAIFRNDNKNIPEIKRLESISTKPSLKIKPRKRKQSPIATSKQMKTWIYSKTQSKIKKRDGVSNNQKSITTSTQTKTQNQNISNISTWIYSTTQSKIKRSDGISTKPSIKIKPQTQNQTTITTSTQTKPQNQSISNISTQPKIKINDGISTKPSLKVKPQTQNQTTITTSTWIENQNQNIFTSTPSTHPPAMECKCELVNQHGEKDTVENLDTLLPWLNSTTKQDLNNHHPNFPASFFYNASREKSCNLIPTIYSIEWRNRYWQELKYEHCEKFVMYSAYYDPNPGGQHRLLILGVTNNKDPTLPWCHAWYSTTNPPIVSRVTQAAYMDWQARNSERQMVYILTCPLPADNTLVPSAVSLVATPCTPASNLLKVIGSREREASAYEDGKIPNNSIRKDVRWNAAVCGPGLYYYSQDFSRRLVEWIEIHRAVGFHRVFLHNIGVHPNMEKVLQYYEKEGFVHVTPFTFPPPYIDEPSLHRMWTKAEHPKLYTLENVFYTDCPLRHMHQYRYLAHLDADELPILKQHKSYNDFIQRLRKQTPKARPGFRLQMNMFYDDLEPKGKAASLPDYLWVLRHTRRPTADLKPQGGDYKALYDMDTARGMFAHGTLWCTTGNCDLWSMDRVPANMAYIGHFSLTCGKKCETANYTTEDLTLQKYSSQVSKAVEKTLRELQLL